MNGEAVVVNLFFTARVFLVGGSFAPLISQLVEDKKLSL